MSKAGSRCVMWVFRVLLATNIGIAAVIIRGASDDLLWDMSCTVDSLHVQAPSGPLLLLSSRCFLWYAFLFVSGL